MTDLPARIDSLDIFGIKEQPEPWVSAASCNLVLQWQLR
jgi:hypothetical protein